MKYYKIIKIDLNTMSDGVVIRYFKKYKNALRYAVALNRTPYLEKYLFKII
jgi:hypothetical protein